MTGTSCCMRRAQRGQGDDVPIGDTKALDSVFSAGRDWDTSVWGVPAGVNFDVGGALPTLRGMSRGGRIRG